MLDDFINKWNHADKKQAIIEELTEQVHKVSEALLDKYADEGIENIEDIKIFKVNPFDDFGIPMKVIDLFGGKKQYLQAITELEQEIYAA